MAEPMPDDPALFRLREFWAIAPEVVLSVWGLIVIAADLTWYRKSPDSERRTRATRLTLVGLLVAFVAALQPIIVRFDLYVWGDRLNFVGLDRVVDTDPTYFLGTISGDPLTEFANLFFLFLLGLVVWMSATSRLTEHWGEYFGLLLWSAVGMMLLTASENLAILFISLELMTICLYLLSAFDREENRSSEAGLKYFIYGSVASAILLFGLSLLYGLTNAMQFSHINQAIFESKQPLGLSENVIGATIILLILVGFGFKLALFPFHQWSPDAYDGAPATVTSWLATGSKVASVLVLSKLLIHALGLWENSLGNLRGPGWVMVVGILSAASMTFGNFAALSQTRLRRMLAYSSVAHAGYLMVGLIAAGISKRQGDAVAALLFYLGIYAVTNLSAFALVVWLGSEDRDDRIENLNGLASRYPWVGLSILVVMISLIGLPPLGGFFGKLWMFVEALNPAQASRTTLIALVSVGLVNTVVSAIYYLRILRAIYFEPEPSRPLSAPRSTVLATLLIGAFLAVATGFQSGPFLSLAKTAGVAMISEGGGVHPPAKAKIPSAISANLDRKPISSPAPSMIRRKETTRDGHHSHIRATPGEPVSLRGRPSAGARERTRRASTRPDRHGGRNRGETLRESRVGRDQLLEPSSDVLLSPRPGVRQGLPRCGIEMPSRRPLGPLYQAGTARRRVHAVVRGRAIAKSKSIGESSRRPVAFVGHKRAPLALTEALFQAELKHPSPRGSPRP